MCGLDYQERIVLLNTCLSFEGFVCFFLFVVVVVGGRQFVAVSEVFFKFEDLSGSFMIIFVKFMFTFYFISCLLLVNVYSVM